LKILVFSQFFPPEIGAAPKRVIEHARYWVQSGHKVIVVTNVPNSPFGKFYPGYKNKLYQKEIVDGIEVRRVWTVASAKSSSKWRRAISFLINFVMYIWGGVKRPKPDIIIASAPYLTGIPGLIASLRFATPLIYEMRDPWVQVGALRGTLRRGGLAHKLLLFMEKIIANRASRIVVVGKEMARFMKNEMQLLQEPEIVHNGVNPASLDESANNKQCVYLPEADGRFIVGSIGNMGNQYNFDVILEAAEDLSDEPCFFIFLGEGAQKKRLEQETITRKLNNIAFYPAVPFSQVGSWIRRCNVTVVSMQAQPIFAVYLPLKILDSLSLGVPVFFGGGGEGEHVLRSSGGGEVFPSGDSKKLAKLIKERMIDPEKIKREGLCGIEFVNKHLSRSSMAQKYLRIVEDAVSQSSY